MDLFRRAILVAALGLSACSGGGGGDTSISLNPKALTFVQELGDSFPTAKRVTVTYRGDGLVVGYPPDEFRTDLVSISDLGGDGHTHEFDIGLGSLGLAEPGELHTRVRFVTGRVTRDGTDVTGIKYKDLAVTYRVVASTFSATTTPGSLNFHATSNGQLPAPQAVEVSFTNGTVFSVTSDSPWLSVTSTPNATSPATLSVAVNSSAFPGGTNLAATINVTIERPTGYRQISIPVGYTVGQPMVVSPATLGFSAMDGRAAAPAPATRSFTISGGVLDWTASSDRPWLALAQTAGTEPATVNFTLDKSGLAPGVHAARVTVHDAYSGAIRYLDVTLTVVSPQLVVTPSEPEFTIDASSDESALVQSVTISDESDGAPAYALDWTVASVNQPWVKVTPAAGSSNPASELTITIDKAELGEIENGGRTAKIVLAYVDSGNVERAYELPVNLDLTLPRARVAAPYTAIAGQAGKAILRGTGFTGVEASQVKFGDTAATSIDVVSDTELRVAVPALAAGRHRVTVANVLEADVSTAELVALTPMDRPYAVFNVDSPAKRIVFDDERETLYAVVPESGDKRIDRYRYADGAWTQLASIPVTDVEDAALSLDGKKLHILARRAVYDLDLDDPLATPVVRNATGPVSPTEIYYWLGVSNDGTAQIASRSTCCSSLYPIYSWKLDSGTVTEYPYPVHTPGEFVLTSGDGRDLYQSYTYRYNASTSQLETFHTQTFFKAVNVDGSRLAADYVQDRSFNFLGQWKYFQVLPAFGRTLRAYIVPGRNDDYVHGQNVVVYDVSATVGTPSTYLPEIKRVAIPDLPTQSPGEQVNSVVSADDRTYFFADKSKVIMVPVGD